MKKRLLIIIVCLLIFSNSFFVPVSLALSAGIKGESPANPAATEAELRNALSAAADGDTIYIGGSGIVLNETLNIEKSVNIVGPSNTVSISTNNDIRLFSAFWLDAKKYSLKLENIKLVGGFGIYADDRYANSSTLEMINCTFQQCGSKNGIALEAYISNINLVNCTFDRNGSESSSKTICYISADSVTIDSCNFYNNYGDVLSIGGYGRAYDYINVIIKNCYISSSHYSITLWDCLANITDTKIVGSTSTNTIYSSGLAVFADSYSSSRVILDRCSITESILGFELTSWAKGKLQADFNNCLITNNKNLGHMENAAATFTNCTLVSNKGGSKTSGINDSDIKLVNCTIAGNEGFEEWSRLPSNKILGSIVSGNTDWQGNSLNINYAPPSIENNYSIVGGSIKDIFGTITPTLGDNGGGLKTALINAGGPARNAIPAGTGWVPSKDQRGYSKPTGVASDIGAIELQPSEYITVTFDSDGGSAVSPVNATKGRLISKPEDPVKLGFKFIGWYNGSNKWNFDTDGVGTSNITLKAQWEASASIVKISFDLANGVIGPNEDTELEPISLEAGSLIPAIAAPHKTGHEFDGWYHGDYKWNFLSDRISSYDITLTARYAAYRTVTLNPDNGNSPNEMQVLEKNKIPEPTRPEKEGYVFLGWFDGNKEWDFETNVVGSENIVLTAHWQINQVIGGMKAAFAGNCASDADEYLVTVGGVISESLVNGINYLCREAILRQNISIFAINTGTYDTQVLPVSSISNIMAVVENGLIVSLEISGTVQTPQGSIDTYTVNPMIRSSSESDPEIEYTKVNDNSPHVTYSGTWYYYSNDPSLYESDQHYSNEAGAYAEFVFTGTSIRWIAATNENLGKCDIYLDGVMVIQSLDLYSPDVQWQQELFSKTGLSNGQHTIRIVVTGEKNISSEDCYVTIDAFEFA